MMRLKIDHVSKLIPVGGTGLAKESFDVFV